MNSNKHLALKIILGTITEYCIIPCAAIKLLDKLLEWLCNHMTVSMISIGVVMIILLGVAAICHDQRMSEEREEFYEKFGGEYDE